MKTILQKLLVGASTLLVLAFGLPSVATPAAAASLTPDTPIWGNVPQAIYADHMKPAGMLPLGKTISIMLGLKAQDVQQMQSVAGQAALGLHQPLTAAGFGAQYGASPSTLQEITSYLEGYGIQVTQIWPDNLMIEARGTVAEMEQAFAVKLDQYTLKGRTVFSNTSEPRLPSAFASDVVTVSGLSNLGLAQPMSQRARSVAKPTQQWPQNYLRGLVPPEIRAAYNVSPAIANGDNGKGQSIGILALSTPSSQADLAAWDAQWGLNPNNVTLIGTSDNTSGPGGQAETNLDIGWSSAMAPGAKIRVYQYNNDTTYDLEADLQTILSDPSHPGVVSVSWGLWEDLIDPSEITFGDELWAQAAAEGISVLVASADYGSYDPYTGQNAVDYPALDPFVTAVGGTNVTISSQGTISSESAWGDCIFPSESGGVCGTTDDSLFLGSGGGYSKYMPAPSWQQSSLPSSETMRGVPDVSMNAVGYELYDSYYGGWSWGWMGTSFAAPITAGIIADADSARGTAIGFLNPTLYALASGKLGLANPFHDITTGSNGAYPAGPGWDAATGLGSIDAWTLVQDLSKIATSGTQGISFMNPTSGGAGTIVTVDGSGFGTTPGTVAVGGTAIDEGSDPNFSWTPNQITFTFPTSVQSPGPVTVSVTPSGGSTYSAAFKATDQVIVQPGAATEVTLMGSTGPTLQPVTVTLEGPNGQTITGSSDQVNLQWYAMGNVQVYSDPNGQNNITGAPTIALQNGQATFYVSDDTAESVEYLAQDITNPSATGTYAFGQFNPGPVASMQDSVGSGVYGPTAFMSVTQATYADLYGYALDANGNLASTVQGNVYYTVGGSAVILPGGQTAPEPLLGGISDAMIGDPVAEAAPLQLSLGNVNLQDSLVFSPVAQIALQPQSTTTDVNGGFTATATLQNAQGQTVSTASDYVALVYCDAQGYCISNSAQAVNGVATITLPTTGLAGQGTLQAFDFGVYNGDTQNYVVSSPETVTVQPGSPQQLVLNLPWTVTTSAGGNVPQSAYQMVEAQTQDEHGNPSPEPSGQNTLYLSITGATGNVSINLMENGQMTPIGPDGQGYYETTLDQTGTAYWYVTDTNPDTLTYTVYSQDQNLNPQEVQGSFTALTPSQLGMQVTGPTSTGGYQPLQVSVDDATGAPVYTSSDTIALAVAGQKQNTVSVYQYTGSAYQKLKADASGDFELQVTQGTATFYVQDTASDTLNYTATDLTTPNLGQATGSGTFTAAAPATMSLTVAPSTVATQGTATISGTVLDQAGNPITGLPVTVQASAGTLAQGTVTTDQNGQFSVDWTAPSQTGTVSFSAQVGSITGTATAQVVSGGAGQSLPLQITGFSILDSSHNPLPSGTDLTEGQQYYLQMTVQNATSQSYVPLFLIEATIGGQVLSLGSVQTSIGAGGTATVTVSFTPDVTGTINLVNLVWSNWLNLGGIPLGAKLAQSAVVQP